MSDYQKPRQRPGYVLTAVSWNNDGTVRSTTYEPVRKVRPAPVEERTAPHSRGLLL